MPATTVRMMRTPPRPIPTAMRRGTCAINARIFRTSLPLTGIMTEPRTIAMHARMMTRTNATQKTRSREARIPIRRVSPLPMRATAVKSCGGCQASTSGDPCGGKNANGLMDPVNFFSGEFYVEEEDLRVPSGAGFDFVWGRKYRSKDVAHTALMRVGLLVQHLHSGSRHKVSVADGTRTTFIRPPAAANGARWLLPRHHQ